MTYQSTTSRARPRTRSTRPFRALIGTVTAALVATTLGVAGSAAGAPTAAPAATSIAIRVLQQVIAPGATATVAGNLTVYGLSSEGRPLSLEAQAQGEKSFTPVGTATAGERGDVRLDVTPAVTTRYRWRYAGADDARSRISGVAVVRVRTGEHPGHRLSTSLSIRAVRAAVAPGGTDIVRSTLAAGDKGLRARYVVLLARPEGERSWQFRKVKRTNRHGGLSFTVRPKVRTDYKVAFAGTRTLQPSRSGVVTVAVRPVVTISLSAEKVDPGQSAIVTGTVTRTGSPVAGARVDLLSRTRADPSWQVAATGRTATDGSITLTATPDVDTRYRLRARAAAGLPTGWSRVVVVGVRAPSSLSISGSDDTADSFVITGRLRAEGHGVGGVMVQLQTLDPATTSWTTLQSARTASTGVVRFIRPSAPGTSYRLVYPGKRYARATSATLTDD